MRNKPLKEFIPDEKAVERAREELAMLQSHNDPLFGSLSGSAIGTPVLVRNLSKEPSYWLVPISIQDKVIGFARVLRDGRIAQIGTFVRIPEAVRDAPSTVTGIEATEAIKQVAGKISVNLGESISNPVFVHDGPIGREAWLFEVIKDGRPVRWIFVTSSGTYERPFGAMRSDDVF